MALSKLLPPLYTPTRVLFCAAADIISAVEFDYDGQHLATGDRGGRVVLFERVHPNVVRSSSTHVLLLHTFSM